jgi:hypothetical protein
MEIFKSPKLLKLLFQFFSANMLLESDVRWIPTNGMLCHDMARITTLCFQVSAVLFRSGTQK